MLKTPVKGISKPVPESIKLYNKVIADNHPIKYMEMISFKNSKKNLSIEKNKFYAFSR